MRETQHLLSPLTSVKRSGFRFCCFLSDEMFGGFSLGQLQGLDARRLAGQVPGATAETRNASIDSFPALSTSSHCVGSKGRPLHQQPIHEFTLPRVSPMRDDTSGTKPGTSDRWNRKYVTGIDAASEAGSHSNATRQQPVEATGRIVALTKTGGSVSARFARYSNTRSEWADEATISGVESPSTSAMAI